MSTFRISAGIFAIVFTASICCADDVIDKVDWPKFLARQDVVYTRLPDKWENGPFTGNGLLGVMFTVDANANDVVFHVGRSDVMDTDADGHETCRLPIGDLVLHTAGKISGGTARLDIWNARITAAINTAAGQINLRTFTHATQNVQVIELQTTGNESNSKFEFRPAAAINPRNIHNKIAVPPEDKNPEARVVDSKGQHEMFQQLTHGRQYATVWQEVPTRRGQTVYLSVGYTKLTNGDATEEAAEAVTNAIKTGIDSLEKSHRDWWHQFYPESFVTLPEARLESFYWMQMYKLASATRPNGPALDLMGPWFRDTPWPKIWWNLNLQLTYYPVYAANRLELGESLCKMIDAGAANLAANAKEFSDDSETVARTTGYECYGPGGNELCDLPWALHNYYMQYRYSMDDTMLRDRIFPQLKKSMNFYFHNMKEGTDGKLHTTTGLSPEYQKEGGHADCNIDLALIRWECQSLLDSCARLKIEDPLIPKWKETLANLTPYPTDENGLKVSADTSFTMSHRHYSHLLMIFPLYTMNWDQPENRDLIAKSFDHWTSLPAGFRGFSYTGASSIASAIGRPDEAVKYLDTWMDGTGIRFPVLANTMYAEAGPVVETPLSGARSIEDLLLQSWGGVLRVFPGVPASWKDVTFQNLRGEGAFLVTAVRKDGKTRFVKIESLAGEPCVVRSDLENPAVDGNISMKSLENGVIQLDLKKGESAVLYPAGSKPDLTIAPVENNGQPNYFGLNH